MEYHFFYYIVYIDGFLSVGPPSSQICQRNQEVSHWLDHTDAKKREILSLVGSLQHATKVVRYGKAFVSRMYTTAAKLRKLHFRTRLNVEFCSDL